MAPWLLAALLLTLCACRPTPPAEALLDDYLAQLEHSLHQPRAEISPLPRPTFPERRHLRQELTDVQVDWLEYWDFRHCGLSELIGERNSVLGRHMTDSGALHLDGRIIRRLRDCIATEEDGALRDRARELLAAKRRQWPARLWNATLASKEMQRFWSYATRPLSLHPPSTAPVKDTLTFWQQLTPRLTTDQPWPSRKALETHFAHLRNRLGGATLKAQWLLVQRLEEANQMLERAAREKSPCPRGHPADTLASRLQPGLYADDIQPYSAGVDSHSRELYRAFAQWLATQPGEWQDLLAPFMRQWRHLQQAHAQASRVHAKHWQAVFSACKMQP